MDRKNWIIQKIREILDEDYEEAREMLDKHNEEIRKILDEDYDIEKEKENLHKEIATLYTLSISLFKKSFLKLVDIMNEEGLNTLSEDDGYNEYYVEQYPERGYGHIEIVNKETRDSWKVEAGTGGPLCEFLKNNSNRRILKAIDTILHVAGDAPTILRFLGQASDEDARVIDKWREYEDRYEEVKEKLEKLEEED